MRFRAESWADSSAATSAMSSVVNTPMSSRAPSRATSPCRRGGAFPFFKLPSELRVNIYEMVLYTPKPLDLDPVNRRLLHPRLALFLVSKQMYEEAYPVFYSQPIRLFPTHGRFFHAKQPLLARLPIHYRNVITTVELRLGPGWTSPPKCQNTNPSLGLRDCTSLRHLKIFVELDPSDTIYAGFRGANNTEDTYKFFCISLLQGILSQAPGLETVEIDAYPGVKKEAPLIMALRRNVEDSGKKLIWGPLRGWEKDADEPGLIGLEEALAVMGISDTPMAAGRLVEVQA